MSRRLTLPLVVLTWLVLGGASPAAASCGDYLHQGVAGGEAVELPDLPLRESPSPCSRGDCRRGPVPMPTPAVPLQLTVDDEPPIAGGEDEPRADESAPSIADDRGSATAGFVRRIDRPPRG